MVCAEPNHVVALNEVNDPSPGSMRYYSEGDDVIIKLPPSYLEGSLLVLYYSIPLILLN